MDPITLLALLWIAFLGLGMLLSIIVSIILIVLPTSRWSRPFGIGVLLLLLALGVFG